MKQSIVYIETFSLLLRKRTGFFALRIFRVFIKNNPNSLSYHALPISLLHNCCLSTFCPLRALFPFSFAHTFSYCFCLFSCWLFLFDTEGVPYKGRYNFF